MQYETNTNAMSYISQIGGSIAALTEVAGDLAALGADGMTLTDNQRARINEALAGVHMAMFRVRQELNRLPAAESALDRLTRAAAPSSTSSTAATRSDVLWHDPDLHRRAGTSRAGPVVIGPFADVASEVVREEVDAWGWTVLSGSARKLTLSQAGREATTCATCGGRLDWVDDAWCRRSCGDEFCR